MACSSSRAGQRGPAVVGQISRPCTRAANARHSRSLPRVSHLPKDHRAFRCRRGLGTQARSRMGRQEHEENDNDDWSDDDDDRDRKGGGRDGDDRNEHAKPQPTLVKPTKEAMGFPTIPGVPAWAPTGLINPVLDYDFGPEFHYSDASGVQTVVPPRIKQVITMRAARVDADGNELGGVPVVLRDAPLGTYLGWNITAAGFHKDKICNYAGGMIPFAKTKAERLASGGDPRLSLQERDVDHDGYVEAVRKAAA